MNVPLWVWAATSTAIVVALLIDLLVFHRDAHEVTMREAAITSGAWIAVGVAFGVGVAVGGGGGRGGEWFTGYLIEKALAVDNIFVFAVILGAFAVPPALQHRVLFFGVVGALVLRAVFIGLGATLIDTFSWTMYLFGALLLVTGVRLARGKGEARDPSRNVLVRALGRVMPVTQYYAGQRFFVRRNGTWFATPLLAALVAIESSDVVFAVDSIPAIFSVTDDTFIVFTSNAFAILGLRSIYFLLAGALHRVKHLSKGLAAILVFIGVKMLLTDVVHVSVSVSLGVIATILAVVGAANAAFTDRSTDRAR
jgi:tellurite resistance protein TerC